MNQFWGVDADPTAQGRIKGARPVAVLDIGSNSVRLVVYERHARALTTLYNEKAACALGRGVAATGRLAEENVSRALTAIQRFALVAKLMRVGRTHVLATSAVREASNSRPFVQAVERMMNAEVRVLSGAEEAHFAALGVVSGMPDFVGVVGDLGGGSLEFSSVGRDRDTGGETYELGVIRLQDDSGGSPEKALVVARERLKASRLGECAPGGQFCAIGGTWRSLAKVYQELSDYPLHMVQHYGAPADKLLELCDGIVAAASKGKTYPGSQYVSSSRRDLVPYGAAAMAEVIRAGQFETVVFSALGVREGYLFELLPPDEQALDPLEEAAKEISLLRSRSPAHAYDLIAFADNFFAAIGAVESAEEKRLRDVACLLSDIGWRGHPDYRGEQSVDMVAYGSVTGINHAGRALIAQALAVRYMGLKHKSQRQRLLALAGPEWTYRARMIGALFRVAYPMSAAMPGILPQASFVLDNNVLTLRLPAELKFLDGEHLRGRLEHLGSVSGHKKVAVVVG